MAVWRASRYFCFPMLVVTLALQAAPLDAWQAEASDTGELDSGFHLLYELKPEQARENFAIWQAAHPEDPLGPTAEAASYLFEEYYRQGILTSAYFLDKKRFLGNLLIEPLKELRDPFFAANLRAQEMARLRLERDPAGCERLARHDP